jgi:hypothetical protein
MDDNGKQDKVDEQQDDIAIPLEESSVSTSLLAEGSISTSKPADVVVINNMLKSSYVGLQNETHWQARDKQLQQVAHIITSIYLEDHLPKAVIKWWEMPEIRNKVGQFLQQFRNANQTQYDQLTKTLALDYPNSCNNMRTFLKNDASGIATYALQTMIDQIVKDYSGWNPCLTATERIFAVLGCFLVTGIPLVTGLTIMSNYYGSRSSR